MKLRLILCKISVILICLCSSLAQAQFTTVTATVTSLEGYPFAGGSVTATFTPITGTIGCTGYILQGVGSMGSNNTPCSMSTVMDSSGTFTLVLADDHKINPFGTFWNFSVCPPISAPCQSSVQDVFGGTIDLSTNISSSLSPLSGNALNLPIFFNDTEINNAGVNSIYFNTISNSVRFWNGLVWNNITAGNSTNLPSGFYNPTTGQFVFPQAANSNTTISGSRFQDSSCTGPWIDFRNAAKTLDLFLVDCNGVVQTPEIFISGPNPQIAIPVANNGTGTTTSLLAKDVSGQWQTIGTGDMAISAYPVLPSNTVNGSVVCAPGINGNTCIVMIGITSCLFDASGGTVDHWVGASTTIAGNCKDLGATLPAGPMCIVGRLLSSPSGGTNGQVLVQPFCYHS